MNPEIANEIAVELMDSDYGDCVHGSATAYRLGCRGPLCNKYNRDAARQRYRVEKPDAKRSRPGSVDPELDQFLDTVIQMHRASKLLASAS